MTFPLWSVVSGLVGRLRVIHVARWRGPGVLGVGEKARVQGCERGRNWSRNSVARATRRQGAYITAPLGRTNTRFKWNTALNFFKIVSRQPDSSC